MSSITRREFLRNAAIGTAALSFTACSRMRVRGANDDIRVAQIGFRSQGSGHIDTLNKIKGVRVVALCDVDSNILDKKALELGAGVKKYRDIRELLADPEIDAVSIATPNHWHALATVLACQAGKDVYVEKPASHNIFEGRKMVEAARKYNRIVQCGTQIRTATGVQEGVEFVRAGGLGRVKLARGFCYKGRKSIGKTTGVQPVPATIDYDLWSGPAQVMAPHRNNPAYGPVHYDWHWFWPYGAGDYGNQAPHQIDLCRWFLGEELIAPFAMSIGGRVGYDDDAETPNSMVTYLGYEKAPIIFEVRGLPRDKSSQADKWEMDKFKGVSIGAVIECEEGYVVVKDNTTATVFDNDGKQVRQFTTGRGSNDPGQTQLTAAGNGHHSNWIDAIRSRRVKDLNADIVTGHISAGLVHTGNISYRLGQAQRTAAIRERLQDNSVLAEAFDRMGGHLDANGVDLANTRLTLGVPLRFEPKRERFIDNDDANRMLTRDYRAQFAVPERV